MFKVPSQPAPRVFTDLLSNSPKDWPRFLPGYEGTEKMFYFLNTNPVTTFFFIFYHSLCYVPNITFRTLLVGARNYDNITPAFKQLVASAFYFCQKIIKS